MLAASAAGWVGNKMANDKFSNNSGKTLEVIIFFPNTRTFGSSLNFFYMANLTHKWLQQQQQQSDTVKIIMIVFSYDAKPV